MPQLVAILGEQVDLTRTMVAFALIMARVMAIVTLVPFLGGKNAPTEVKMGVGVALSLIIWPTAMTTLTGPIPISPIGFLLMMLKETFVGLTIGFAASKVFYMVEISGQLIDILRGANQIQLQVPEIEERSSAFGSLQFQMLLGLFLALDLHHPFMVSLFESFRIVPLNDWPHFRVGFWPFVEYMARITADIIFIAVLMAMPIGIVTLIVEAGFGLMNRVAPQINAYFMAMPAKVLGGCIIFFLAFDMILEAMLVNGREMLSHVAGVIQLMD
jgi:flagellar biosynthesis protein FliR